MYCYVTCIFVIPGPQGKVAYGPTLGEGWWNGRNSEVGVGRWRDDREQREEYFCMFYDMFGGNNIATTK